MYLNALWLTSGHTSVWVEVCDVEVPWCGMMQNGKLQLNEECQKFLQKIEKYHMFYSKVAVWS
jgi:hypothetical protein